jgi:hypothetical protein
MIQMDEIECLCDWSEALRLPACFYSPDWVFVFAQISSAVRAVRYLNTDSLVSSHCRRPYEEQVI